MSPRRKAIGYTGAALCAVGLAPSFIGAATALDITCAIENVRQTGDIVELRGVVRADEAASGIYRFMVSKADTDGTSNSMQSGRFELTGQSERLISAIHLSLIPGGRYEAKLTLHWAVGSMTCQRTEKEDA